MNQPKLIELPFHFLPPILPSQQKFLFEVDCRLPPEKVSGPLPFNLVGSDLLFFPYRLKPVSIAKLLKRVRGFAVFLFSLFFCLNNSLLHLIDDFLPLEKLFVED